MSSKLPNQSSGGAVFTVPSNAKSVSVHAFMGKSDNTVEETVPVRVPKPTVAKEKVVSTPVIEPVAEKVEPIPVQAKRSDVNTTPIRGNAFSSVPLPQPSISFEFESSPDDIIQEIRGTTTPYENVNSSGAIYITGQNAQVTINQTVTGVHEVQELPIVSLERLLSLTSLEEIASAENDIKYALEVINAKKLLLDAESKIKG